jgi:hypothetical protein
MKALHDSIVTILLAAVLAMGVAPGPVQADAGDYGARVSWERIVGIVVPQGLVGVCESGPDCATGTPAPWTVTRGSAAVNLDNGRVRFTVQGLVLAADPSFTNIGTPGLVSMVKGTLVCNESDEAELVDTDAVPLSAQGDAKFQGYLVLPASCTSEPEDIVFLIRIADGEPALLIDRWNAFGAVRTAKSGLTD